MICIKMLLNETNEAYFVYEKKIKLSIKYIFHYIIKIKVWRKKKYFTYSISVNYNIIMISIYSFNYKKCALQML